LGFVVSKVRPPGSSSGRIFDEGHKMPVSNVIEATNADCDICNRRATGRTTAPNKAAYDFGGYRRIAGVPGLTRFVCERCAVGVVSPRHADKLRMPTYPAGRK
jgi:hypothetical protein